jgi:hypothetical protein
MSSNDRNQYKSINSLHRISMCCFKLLQILFLFLVVWLFFRSPGPTRDFSYKLEPSNGYAHERISNRLDIKYYIDNDVL